MIVLDTNVVSEMMKPADRRAAAVVEWLDRQPGERLFTTTITMAEIRAGLAIMPDRHQRTEKRAAAEQLLALFAGRVLPFDMASTHHYGESVTIRLRAAKSIDAFDLLIAAIARSNSMAVATRNVVDFEDCGVDLIDPWEA